ncbi:hypothetical protein [Litorimonas haliclonae]|uniref:hypothetical protein n=1 Tax=Litorimonas haliclonae TaxID=2081977 RepID=UPI0039EED8FB
MSNDVISNSGEFHSADLPSDGYEGMLPKWMSFAVLVTFSVLLTLGYFTFLDGFIAHPKAMALSLIPFALISIVVLRNATFTRQDSAAKSVFGKIVLLALPIAALAFLYVCLFSGDLKSDFEAYWDLARQFSQGLEVDWGSVYHARARAMLSPAVFLFGHHELSFEVFNVLYIFSCAVSVGWIAYRCAGIYASKIAMFATLLCAGPIAWAIIPTHDLPGSAVFLLCIVYIVELCRVDASRLSQTFNRKWTFLLFIASAIFLGMALGWIQFIKAATPFYVVGGILALIIGGSFSEVATKARPFTSQFFKNVLAKTGFLFLPVLIAMCAQNIVPGADNFHKFERGAGGLTEYWIAAHTNSYGDGSYSNDIGRFFRPYRYESSDEAIPLAVANMSDDPMGSVVHRFRKAERLMNFASLGFGVGSPERASSEATPKETIDIKPIFAFLAHTYWLLLLASTLIIIFSKKKLRSRAAIVLTPSLVAAGALIMLGQVQARYMMPLWFVGIILIGLAAASIADFKTMTKPEMRTILKRGGLNILQSLAVLVGVAVIGLIVFVAGSRLIYQPQDGRPVYLEGNVRSVLGGEAPSPYAFRGTTRPYFEVNGTAVSLPDALIGQPLEAWTLVRLPRGTDEECFANVSVAGGGDATAPVRLENGKASRLLFIGAKQVEFEYEKTCGGVKDNTSLSYEIAFIRAVSPS